MRQPPKPAARHRRTFLRSLLASAGVWASSWGWSRAAAGSAGHQPRVDEDVRRASDEWFEALRQTDMAAIDRLETDDFLTIQEAPTGVAVIEKKAQLGALKTGKSTSIRLGRELSNVRIRHYGETAILTAVAVFRRDDADPQAAGNRAVITEVWIRENNRWRIAHFATHPVRPPVRR